MTPIPDFKITNSIRFRGELKNQVLRRFKEGVRKSIKEGESIVPHSLYREGFLNV